jgi:Zn-dependent alcohol dehydrogenase
MNLLKIVDYINTVRVNFNRRVKDVRIEVYNDHVAECESCKSGYNAMCDKGRSLLIKCIDDNKYDGELKRY